MALNIEFVQGGAVRASLTVRARPGAMAAGPVGAGAVLDGVHRLVPVDLERLGDGHVQPLERRRRVAGRADARPQDHELVTADAGQHVAGAQAGGEAGADVA
ncbi:hypothetical protein GCM10022255_018610 [Dactylosporangium darangshiense]|uniref:Uncharacterized protein n=1 Tax=Dactylosporangium darangshiense TaxID=579108 RepID=A0ABP8D371_9ACTN